MSNCTYLLRLEKGWKHLSMPIASLDWLVLYQENLAGGGGYLPLCKGHSQRIPRSVKKFHTELWEWKSNEYTLPWVKCASLN